MIVSAAENQKSVPSLSWVKIARRRRPQKCCLCNHQSNWSFLRRSGASTSQAAARIGAFGAEQPAGCFQNGSISLHHYCQRKISRQSQIRVMYPHLVETNRQAPRTKVSRPHDPSMKRLYYFQRLFLSSGFLLQCPARSWQSYNSFVDTWLLRAIRAWIWAKVTGFRVQWISRKDHHLCSCYKYSS